MTEDTRSDDEEIYVSRLLAHAAGQSSVADNTIFQLSIMLARVALEENDPQYARETANLLAECIRNKPAPATNVVDLTAFKALRA